ncbi:unnamed protein product [Arabis nemorensis]|uniref:Uncharacterized protein n=1 Tax=Arabis nemorensis TaxID=586526 RepID=A0A565CH03_9BRAS|nr:unnamed protein product [Arabis nemorensis]
MGNTAEPTLAQLMAAIQGLTNRMTQLENQQNQETESTTESTTESSTDPARATLTRTAATATDKPVIKTNHTKTATAHTTAQDNARTEKNTSHGTVERV